MPRGQQIVLVDQVEPRILLIRGQKVLLDKDLAELYGVTTKRLNQQVRRNRHRFPEDFLFQLAIQETAALRSQIATSKPGRGGRRYRQHTKNSPTNSPSWNEKLATTTTLFGP